MTCESGLMLVLRLDRELIITVVNTQSSQEFGTYERIDSLQRRDRVRLLQGYFVKFLVRGKTHGDLSFVCTNRTGDFQADLGDQITPASSCLLI